MKYESAVQLLLASLSRLGWAAYSEGEPDKVLGLPKLEHRALESRILFYI